MAKVGSQEVRAKQSEGGKKGGARSSRKGIPNRRTKELQEKMERLGCDPAEFLARTMLNDLEQAEHPLVTMIINNRKKLPTVDEWKEIKRTASKAREEFLMFIPQEQRQKAAADLMPYLYNKLKQISLEDEDGAMGNLVALFADALSK